MRASALGLSALLIGMGAMAPAASAQATCNAYFTASQGMSDTVNKAYEAMNAKNIEALKTMLPALEALFKPLPATEIKAEVCDANHINAYTSYQNAQLSFLRAKGVDIGFPANLPIIKQPELNHAVLAYGVGWIKYELADYAGALVAYEKGLAMFPHYGALQQEYLATLMQLKRYKDLIAFADKLITNEYDISDADRGKIYLARGIALMATNDLVTAEDSVTVAIRYNSTKDANDVLKQIQDARKAKPN